jgi:Peptidase of plants and bacteria
MTKRQTMTHLRRVLAAYVPGVANRTGLPERDYTMGWAAITSPAATLDDVIMLNWEWFSNHPDDYGALVHEYVHVIQSVPRGTCPGDVIEGFADATRFIFGLFDPSWWSPSPTARLIAELTYEKFQRLSQAMAAGEYDPLLLYSEGLP